LTPLRDIKCCVKAFRKDRLKNKNGKTKKGAMYSTAVSCPEVFTFEIIASKIPENIVRTKKGNSPKWSKIPILNSCSTGVECDTTVA
jgi:hypothetical protein